MPSVGPKYPTIEAAVDNDNIGGIQPFSTGNAGADDGAADQCFFGTFDVTGSQLLKLRGFDFSEIPLTARIDGLVLEVRHACANLSGSTIMSICGFYFALNGVQTGARKNITKPVAAYATITIGGAANPQGLTVTGADLRNANFGIWVEGQVNDTAGAEARWDINYARLTAYYTPVSADDTSRNRARRLRP